MFVSLTSSPVTKGKSKVINLILLTKQGDPKSLKLNDWLGKESLHTIFQKP